MWGGATRVPEPKELEGLTGISFPLNGAPMGTTLLGLLMCRDNRNCGCNRWTPINIYLCLHTSPIHSLLYYAYLRKHIRCYWGSWDHHQIQSSHPSAQ